jgi:hypothetical protein
MQNSSSTNSVGPNRRWIVPAILFVSLLLRWILVLRGGQYYFSDEGRYTTSRAFAESILQGKFTESFSQFFIAPEHLGFKIIGIIPALIEQFTRESLAIPALFFSLFSTLNLFIIYKISQRMGVSARESLFALILAASSMSLLYYARHIMPYDSAMTFGLLAVYTALAERPGFKTSPACGALGFACFITYNGYWSLAALGMLIHAFRGSSNIGELIRKASLTAVGFALPAILLFFPALLAGTNLLIEYRTFSTTVSQGSFDEGWSLPFEYFWHTEYLVFIALIALSIFAVVHAFERKDNSPILWAGAIAFLYLSLVVPSVFLHSFVVYGRLARQMTPFLVLLSASGLARLEQVVSSAQKLTKFLLAIIVVQAAWNYKASFDLSYPREFAQQAQAQFPEFQFSEKRLAFGAPTLCQNNGYIIEFAKHFAVPPEPNPPVQGQLLLSAPHPDNFLPYQYEGYTYGERQKLRELQIEMRFYKVNDEFILDSNPIWKTMKNCVVNED